MARGSIIRPHGLLYCSLLRGSRAWGRRMGLRSAWGPASQTQEFSGATLSSDIRSRRFLRSASQLELGPALGPGMWVSHGILSPGQWVWGNKHSGTDLGL